MIKLTTTQFETLEFIRHFQKEKGFPPSRSEIAQHFKIAQNAANDRVIALEKKGALAIIPGIARGLVLFDDPIKVAA